MINGKVWLIFIRKISLQINRCRKQSASECILMHINEDVSIYCVSFGFSKFEVHVGSWLVMCFTMLFTPFV